MLYFYVIKKVHKIDFKKRRRRTMFKNFKNFNVKKKMNTGYNIVIILMIISGIGLGSGKVVSILIIPIMCLSRKEPLANKQPLRFRQLVEILR